MLVKGRETTRTCRRSCASHSCGHCLSMKRQRSRHAGCVTRHPGQSARSGPWAAPVLRNTSRSHLTCSRGLRSSHLDDHKVWAPSGSHSCVCVCVCSHTHTYHTPSGLAQLAARATIALQGPGPSPAFYFGLDRSAEMVYAAGHSPESLRNELMRRAAGVSFSFRKQPSEEFFSRSFYILTKKHVNARAREAVADSRVIKVHKTSSERMEVLCGRRLCRDDVPNPTRCHKRGFDVFRGLPPFLPQKPPALPAGARMRG